MNKLGKNLSALITDENGFSYHEHKKIRLDALTPSKFQHRTFFSDEKLQELSTSIKKNGVIQPIIVRRKKKSDEYEIIAGERRTRASKIAGLQGIPAIIINVPDKIALEISIIENIQRDDLNVIEEANSYKNLIDEFNYLQEELSKIVGKSRSHITNCLRILSLPDDIKDLVIKRHISKGHARALIGVTNAIDIANKIVKKSLSVRQTESLIKKLNGTGTKEDNKKSKDIICLEEKISSKLGLEVKINDYNKNSSVVIKFNDLPELNLILKKLSFNSEDRKQ